jgi:hypothetical protein
MIMKRVEFTDTIILVMRLVMKPSAARILGAQNPIDDLSCHIDGG